MKIHSRFGQNLFACSMVVILLAQGHAIGAEPGRWTMLSENPANHWRDAFVTGNGRHGTMVMGHPGKETVICVHEELFVSAWDRDVESVADIAHLLPEVRKLIRDGKPADAAELAVEAVRKQNEPRGVTNDGWPVVPHPAFDLDIQFESSGPATDYQRQLNLETGEAFSQWADTAKGVEQRVFSSQTHNLNVVELRATGDQKLNLALRLAERPGRIDKNKPKHRNVEMNGAFNSITTDAAPGWLFYHADYALDRGGYEGVARVTTVGGTTVQDDETLQIQDADRVLILIRIQPLEDGKVSQKKMIQQELKALPNDYESLLKPHADKHGEMFRRVTLDLGCEKQWREESTEKLLADIHTNGVTPRFLEAIHAMGRYLLISTSGKYPAPLQGIWGADWRASWGGSFTTNSNVNLAISSFGMGNLPEIAEGYYGYIERQLPGWRANAKKYLGCRGILASLNMDPETGYETHFHAQHPVLYWVGGTGWNIRPLYDFALLSGDDAFMKEKVLPLYLELGLFYEDYLVKGEDGIYDVIPSQSPENDPGGKRGERLTENSTFSVAVARETFSILLELGKQFDLPADDIAKWKEIHDHLPAYRINQDGALAEWIPEQYKDNYSHRHNSHLYPVYPGMELVEPTANPALDKAVRVALEKRCNFDTTSAHGLMHAALMASRLRDVEKVRTNLDRFSRRQYLSDSFVTSHNPNHGVYNLDAALSLPRLLMEMLVFSRPSYIRLMPGWPEEYADGTMTGILVRGGHKIDVTWADGKLKSAVLYAGKDGPCEIHYRDASQTLELKAGEIYHMDGSLATSTASAQNNVDETQKSTADTLDQDAELRGDIIYSTGFDTDDWLEDWDHAGHRDSMNIVDPNEINGIPPLKLHGKSTGNVLQVTIAKDGHYGCGPQFMFDRHLGYRPKEMYARFDCCFAEDFVGYGGKAPGWGGTEKSGWGGKPSDGFNGWSARGGIHTNRDGTLAMSYYTYHALMPGKYGDSFRWSGDAAKIVPGRWYCIEQYCKINSPGESDGVLRAWVDGRLVLDKTDVQMRKTDKLGLKFYWLNYYFGGKGVSSQARHVYLDNMAFATDNRLNALGQSKTDK
ncbi:hypothetical protein CA13_73360 [Planctomycetes bacterium CA13]|uniref:Uncharacterized protein n=1 Tax=Novipirellula herctigrandis TaxID=2527986 RepID=A0A5C5YLE3_9BACT|nr:hypothetical protein CA13_73360 [Planctomycetes bacterium CA13]